MLEDAVYGALLRLWQCLHQRHSSPMMGREQVSFATPGGRTGLATTPVPDVFAETEREAREWGEQRVGTSVPCCALRVLLRAQLLRPLTQTAPRAVYCRVQRWRGPVRRPACRAGVQGERGARDNVRCLLRHQRSRHEVLPLAGRYRVTARAGPLLKRGPAYRVCCPRYFSQGRGCSLFVLRIACQQVDVPQHDSSPRCRAPRWSPPCSCQTPAWRS